MWTLLSGDGLLRPPPALTPDSLARPARARPCSGVPTRVPGVPDARPPPSLP